MGTNPLTLVVVVMIFMLFWLFIGQRRISKVTESTHVIVNSQRSMMLHLIASLSQRIAEDNPKDEKAQDAARFAKRESELSDNPRRVSI